MNYSQNFQNQENRQQNYQRVKCITKIGQWKIFYDQKEKSYLIKARDLNDIENLISLQLGEQEKQYIQQKQMQRKMNNPTTYQQERRNRFLYENKQISDLEKQLDIVGIEDESLQQAQIETMN